MFEAVNNIIKIATKYNAKCFGDYVINVLVPQEKYKGNFQFTNLDFVCYDDFEDKKFLDEAGIINNEYNLEGKTICKVRIFKNYNCYPPLDFNSNQLVVQIDDDGILNWKSELAGFSVEDLKTDILDKKAWINDNTIYDLSEDSLIPFKNWRLYYRDGTLIEENDLNWIRKNYNHKELEEESDVDERIEILTNIVEQLTLRIDKLEKKIKSIDSL